MPKHPAKLSFPPRLFFVLVWVVYILAVAMLAYSAFRSGYSYTFDNDEYLHAHVVYLIDHGKLIFRDIFSVYTPIYHWFLLPFYRLYGYSLETIQFTRYVMILLFILRMAAGAFIALKLFGRRVAMLFVPLHLLDPFAVFTNMQIRPDNLMLTAYTLGVAVLVGVGEKRKPAGWFAGGILLSLAVLINIKIVPVVAVTGFLLLGYQAWKRQWWSCVSLIAGGLAPAILFCLYFAGRGTFQPMLQQILVDARLTNETRMFAVPTGFFYHPSNLLVFGAPDRPLNWLYAWFLPLAAFAGAYTLVIDWLKQKNASLRETQRLILSFGLLAAWSSLLVVRSLFIQYYIPTTWFFALTAAVSIAGAATSVKYRRIPVLLLLLGLLLMVQQSFRANMVRATSTGESYRDMIRMRWAQIPPEQPVFPDFLFRPSVYPISYGYAIGEIPQAILNRYPTIPDVITTNRLPFVLIDSYQLNLLPADAKFFIQDTFTSISPADPDYRLRNR